MLRPYRYGYSFTIAALSLLSACSAQRDQISGSSFVPTAEPQGSPHNGGPVIKEYAVKSKKIGQIFDLAFDAAKNLWFNSYSPYVGRMTPGGLITVHPLPRKRNSYGLESVNSMAFGPGQNIWFTDFLGKEIGTIDRKGTIREYQPFQKTGYAFTNSLLPRPLHVWVTMDIFDTGYIAEANQRAKVVRAIYLPGYFCYPGPITADKTGTFWIGNSGNCPKITRVTPDGKVRDFAIKAADGVWGIAAGPDGNIWFTAADNPTTNDYVGKITPTGKITTYPITNQADGIALGPDGNWWITMPFVGKIESMNLQGKIVAEYTLPNAINGSQPEFQACLIHRGPDGNMWFGEGARNKIGELIFSK